MADKKIIVISDQDPGFPYSKGKQASELMVTGLPLYRAYQVAEQVEVRLLEREVVSVTTQELDDVTVDVLSELAGERYATNWLRWGEVKALDVPKVIMVGGATGVGKSELATQLAVRLGIVRVVGTDAIREVMRALFTSELMPTLYTSSFAADAALREPPPRPLDRVIVGFREQTAAVAVGIRALVERAAVEGNSIIIEGAHVVPGFFDLEAYEGRVLGVPLVVTVDEEGRHRNYLAAQSSAAPARSLERRMQGFPNIRRVQKYIKSQALSHNVPVIANYSLDQALSATIDLVVERATEYLTSRQQRDGSKRRHPSREATRLEASKT